LKLDIYIRMSTVERRTSSGGRFCDEVFRRIPVNVQPA
jgi:hypothetical protein